MYDTLYYLAATAVTAAFHMVCMSLVLVPVWMWRNH